jgi:alpha/beta superfamily hydrolase
MSKLPRSERVFVEGPAGPLEALYEAPADAPAMGAAVVCHPHPQYGGTLQNKVVHTLARAFVAQNFLAMRFNFRGVGASEGAFDDGPGELQDALAASRAARQRCPDGPLWFAGFSFGAAVAIGAAAEVDADGLVSVAPAMSRVKGPGAKQPACPWLIVQGDEDDLVGVDDTIAWVNELDPGPELRIFESTDHFFHGQLVPLRKVVESFIAEHAPALRES